MGKIAVVFWSGTGNTEAMAEAVVNGVESVTEDVELFQVDEFSVDKMSDYDGFIFGCPAMGDEVLEEDSFEPFFAEVEKEKKLVFTGDIFVNVKGFTPEQYDFNLLAPYLMGSVNTDSKKASACRKILISNCEDYLLCPGHGKWVLNTEN